MPAAVLAATKWALEKNAQDPVLLDVRGLCGYTDFILILGGRSARQVKAIGDALARGMRGEGYRTLGYEGTDDGRWVLLDYGEVVVHVFLDELRAFYDLESLWDEAPRVSLQVPGGASKAGAPKA